MVRNSQPELCFFSWSNKQLTNDIVAGMRPQVVISMPLPAADSTLGAK